MTDPLTAKELVEKSFDYVERLGKECSKALLDDYNRNRRKFAQANLTKEVSTNIVEWFSKRDKNLRLRYEGSNYVQSNSQHYLKFRGNTKDADFPMTATLLAFTIPVQSENKEAPTCVVKNLVLSVNKTEFTRRK